MLNVNLNEICLPGVTLTSSGSRRKALVLLLFRRLLRA